MFGQGGVVASPDKVDTAWRGSSNHCGDRARPQATMRVVLCSIPGEHGGVDWSLRPVSIASIRQHHGVAQKPRRCCSSRGSGCWARSGRRRWRRSALCPRSRPGPSTSCSCGAAGAPAGPSTHAPRIYLSNRLHVFSRQRMCTCTSAYLLRRIHSATGAHSGSCLCVIAM